MTETAAPPGPATRAVTVYSLCLGWMFSLRAVLLLQGEGAGFSIWILPADAAAALCLAILAPWLARPVPRIALALIAGVAYYAAGEHLHAHASLFRLAHIGQTTHPEFLSATLLSSDTLFIPLYAAISLLWLHFLSRRVITGASRRRLVAIPLLLALYFLAVPTPTHPANNVLLSALIQVPGGIWRSLPREAETELVLANGTSDPAFFLRQDSGQNNDQNSGHDTNHRPDVLLILIEGLSGAYLPSIAAHHGLAPEIALPDLDRLLSRHGFTVYPNMLSLQRQTNRGSYPLLCGDYPKIVTAVPKMTVVAGIGEPLDCLPRLLREQGYHTTYMQAAPLSYMNKNEFMPLIGFEELIGQKRLLARGLQSGDWGPDDAEFLGAARQRITALADGEQPWFITLLTVGTHHPYQPAPEMDARTARREAFTRMSRALGDFIDSLAAAGALDDAWVILTSDEAGGFRERGGRPLVLANNFGMLAIRPPRDGSSPRLAPHHGIVAQIDVPVTVLDILGLSGQGNMIGRSLLAATRRSPRGLLFGDTYLARSYFLYEDGRLLDCGEALMRCRQWRFQPDRLFGTLTETERPLALDFEDRATLAGNASLVRDLGVATADSYRMAPGEIMPDRPYRGGQHLQAVRGDRLELRLKGRILSPPVPAGGSLRVVLRDAVSNERLAGARLRVPPTGEFKRQVNLTVDRAQATVSVELHWQPDRPGQTLALQELVLTVGKSTAEEP